MISMAPFIVCNMLAANNARAAARRREEEEARERRRDQIVIPEPKDRRGPADQ